jgi:nucleoside-diphosphate-sugar epimerase
MKTTSRGPILVTGAAGQLGAVERVVTALLLDRGRRQ